MHMHVSDSLGHMYRIPRATKETSVQNLAKRVVERRGNDGVVIVALKTKDAMA